MTLLRRFGLFSLVPAFLLAGCANKNGPNRQAVQNETQPAQDAQLAAAVADRLHEVQTRVNAFEADSRRLPGASEAENRRLMQETFAHLGEILPLIEGSSPSSEFRQGMRVLDSSRQQLASGPTNLATEPTIGQGLRAAARLLVHINALVFGSDPDIAKQIEGVQQTVNQLDTAHGAMNRVVAAQVVRGTAGVLRQMSAALADRAGLQGPKPTTDPAAAKGGSAAAR